MQLPTDDASRSQAATVPLSLTSLGTSNAQRESTLPASLLTSTYAITLPQPQSLQSQAPNVMFIPNSQPLSLPSGTLPHGNLQQHSVLSDQTLHLMQQQQLQQHQFSRAFSSLPLINLQQGNHPSNNPIEPQNNNAMYLQLEQAIQAQSQARQGLIQGQGQAQGQPHQATDQVQNTRYLQLEQAQQPRQQQQQQQQQQQPLQRESQLPFLQQYHLAGSTLTLPGRYERSGNNNNLPVYQSVNLLGHLHQPMTLNSQPLPQPLTQPLDLSSYLVNEEQLHLQQGQGQGQGQNQRSSRMSEETDEGSDDDKTLDKKDKRRKKNRIAQRNFRSRQRQMLHDAALEIEGYKSRIRELERIVADQQLQINRLSSSQLGHQTMHVTSGGVQNHNMQQQ